MNWQGIRSRLARIESRPHAPAPLFSWDEFTLEDDGAPDSSRAEAWSAMLEEAEQAHARAMEEHPAGLAYRAEVHRLGMPQPETLRGIDLIEECIRLAGLADAASADAAAYGWPNDAGPRRGGPGRETRRVRLA